MLTCFVIYLLGNDCWEIVFGNGFPGRYFRELVFGTCCGNVFLGTDLRDLIFGT